MGEITRADKCQVHILLNWFNTFLGGQVRNSYSLKQPHPTFKARDDSVMRFLAYYPALTSLLSGVRGTVSSKGKGYRCWSHIKYFPTQPK